MVFRNKKSVQSVQSVQSADKKNCYRKVNFMDSQNFIEYKIHDPISNNAFVTRSYDEALAYYDRGWLVVENNVTICRLSVHYITRSEVAMTWNNNPDFESED
jgi:hypothetical protein